MKQLIKNYINKLTINDTKALASKNNINLNDDELNFVHNQIKNNWYTLIYGDPTNLFNELKSKVSNTNYLKIKDLYTTYKQKYQSFL